MKLTTPLVCLVLLSNLSIASETAPWPLELSETKTLDVAWEDLEGPPVKRTITGDDLKKVQHFFRKDATGNAYKCMFHRDASLTLPSGRRVDLCFGCGLARTGEGDASDVPFDKAALKKVYVSLLGKQPAQKNLFGGY